MIANFLNDRYKDLDKAAADYQAAYREAAPFPNIYFREFFNPALLDLVLEEFPDLSQKDAIVFDNPEERKLGGKGEAPFGHHTRMLMHYLNSQPFLQFLQQLTGIKELLTGDPYFIGGGLHEIKRGGLLKIHADFNKHPDLKLDRRINVLVYLNKDWKEEYGGHFELWDKSMQRCEKKILPEFNTMAIFSTTDFSYHGHPDPLNCPEGRSRKSMALYYYSHGRPPEEIGTVMENHSTLFKARAGNKEEELIMRQSMKKTRTFRDVLKDFIPPIFVKAFKRLKGTGQI